MLSVMRVNRKLTRGRGAHLDQTPRRPHVFCHGAQHDPQGDKMRDVMSHSCIAAAAPPESTQDEEGHARITNAVINVHGAD